MKTSSIILIALCLCLLHHRAQGSGEVAQREDDLPKDGGLTGTTETPSLRDKKCYPSIYDRKHRSVGYEALPRCSCGHLRWHYPAKTLKSSFYRDMPYRYYVCVKILFLDAIISWWEILKTNVQKKLLPPARETYCFASYKGTVNIDFESTKNVTFFQTLIKYQAPLEVPITTPFKRNEMGDLLKTPDASEVHSVIYESKFGDLLSTSTTEPTKKTPATEPAETEKVTKYTDPTLKTKPTEKRTYPTTKPTEKRTYPATKPTVKRTYPTTKPTVKRTYPTTKPTVKRTYPTTKPTVKRTYPTTKPTVKRTYPTTKPTVKRTYPTTKPTVKRTYPTTKPTVKRTYPTTKPTVKRTYPATKPTEKRTYPKTKPTEKFTYPTAKPTESPPTRTVTINPERPDYVVITIHYSNGGFARYYVLRHLYEKRHGPLIPPTATTQALTSHSNSAKQTTTSTEATTRRKFVYNSREMPSRHRRGAGVAARPCDCAPIQRQSDCSCGIGVVEHVGGAINRDEEKQDEEIKARLGDKTLLTLKALCQKYPYWTDGKTVKPCEEVWSQCKDSDVPRTVRK